jgi:hypothetical protein
LVDEAESEAGRNKTKLIDYTKMENLNSKSSALGMAPLIPESPVAKK